jgi:hypothetical protein
MSRRQADILNPTGTGDLSPIRGLQERNQRNLLEIFSAAKPVLEEIAKVKPETWRSMSGLFTALEGTFGRGVEMIAGGALRPLGMLQNRFTNMLEGFLAPVMVAVNNISNQIESFALQNQQGATIGAIGGGIIGAFFGHPYLGAIFGSLLGAGVESAGRGLANEYGDAGWTPPRTLFGPFSGDGGGVDISGATQFAQIRGMDNPNIWSRPFPNRRGIVRKFIRDFE